MKMPDRVTLHCSSVRVFWSSARADGDTLLESGLSGEKIVNGKPKDSGDDRARDPHHVERGGKGDPQIEPESMVVQVVNVVPAAWSARHEGSYRVPEESGPTRSVRVEPADGRDMRGSLPFQLDTLKPLSLIDQMSN